jgi:hypothetical protein
LETLHHNGQARVTIGSAPGIEAASAARERFEFQLKMLESGATQVQSQIARLDDLLFKLKASFVTVWLATVGWAMTIMSRQLLLLALIVAIAFWMFEGVFRGAQARFIDRARHLTLLFNDSAALERAFTVQQFPPNVVFPISFHESEWDQLRFYVRGLIAPSVAILYMFVIFVTYLLWLAVPF